MVVRCGCVDRRLQSLVEGVDVDVSVGRSRDVEEVLFEFVVGVSSSWPSC